MKGLILAAGLGTRFRPHTEVLPKQAFPFLNVPLLHYAVHVAELFSAKEVFFNTHHLPQQIEKLIAAIPGAQFTSHTSHESQILGNAGALTPLRHQLENDIFFVLNSDTVILPPQPSVFSHMLSKHRQDNALATLLVMEHPQAGKQYGAVWVGHDLQVLGFGKQPPPEAPQAKPYHFTGVRLFHPKLFGYLPIGESDIKQVLSQAIAKAENVKALVANPMFFDGGSLEEFLKDSLLALREAETSVFLQTVFARFWPQFSQRPSLFMGTNCELPPAYLHSRQHLFGNNVRIHESVIMNGFCIFGDNVTVSENCILENVVVMPNKSLKKSTSIKNNLILNA